MPITRNGTERPREPILQLSVAAGRTMCRIARRLRCGGASPRGAAGELMACVRLAPNPLLGGDRLAGSLTGVFASKSVTEASKGALRPIGNRP